MKNLKYWSKIRGTQTYRHCQRWWLVTKQLWKYLEALGTEQGDVRKLKGAKTENYAIKVEVGKLLELKKQLAKSQLLKAMKCKIFIFRFSLYKQEHILHTCRCHFSTYYVFSWNCVHVLKKCEKTNFSC